MNCSNYPEEAWRPTKIREALDTGETESDYLICPQCNTELCFRPGTCQSCPTCNATFVFCNHVVEFKFLCQSIQTRTYIFMCGRCLLSQVKHQDFFQYWVIIG